MTGWIKEFKEFAVRGNVMDMAVGVIIGAAFGKIESICMGLGVEKEHIRVIKPLKNHHEENVQVIKEEIAYQGVSVIIPRRECIQTAARHAKEAARAKAAAEKK